MLRAVVDKLIVTKFPFTQLLICYYAAGIHFQSKKEMYVV